MKTCLVSGITGMIGHHLAGPLSRDYHVIGITRQDNFKDSQTDGIDYLQMDLVEEGGMDRLKSTADIVIHLAQSEHFREFPDKAEDVFRVNTLSTLQLLDHAKRSGAKTFILASSGGIYGYGDHEFSEDVTLSPRGDLGFYLGTKMCSEVIAENYTPYMNIIILRFFFVYGPGQRRSMLIPRLVRSVKDGRPVTLQGPDGIRINPTYVSDAVAAIMQCLELEGSHKINIGGPQILSLRAIGETIGKALDKEPRFIMQPEAEPHHLAGDIQKMARLLGPPSVTFDEGIRSVIEEF
ncbi:MAG: NAD(P)-dependent oxidoreductase [bacterium]|nr:NAD(P)-dependent oxidoreductase [bacterium]